MARVQILEMERRLLILHPWNDDQPLLNWDTRALPVYEVPEALLTRWLAVLEEMTDLQRELARLVLERQAP
jgi:hypothetical protein